MKPTNQNSLERTRHAEAGVRGWLAHLHFVATCDIPASAPDELQNWGMTARVSARAAIDRATPAVVEAMIAAEVRKLSTNGETK